jgi:hypothetical protein
VEADFNHPFINSWKFTASAIATYRSTYTISADENPLYGVEGGFVKYDANIAFSKDAWTIAVIGKNISDKLTKSFAYNFNGIGVADLDETREILLQVHVKF